VAPDRQAPAEYLKHPVLFATTETERSEPPMMAPDGSNGDEGPTSTTKPLSFSVLFQVTFVPTFTQKREFPLAFGMLGVADAESDVRFTSTVQGVEADPHVLAAVHCCTGFASMQAYLLFFDWAAQ
jgi:hypothetical protein